MQHGKDGTKAHLTINTLNEAGTDTVSKGVNLTFSENLKETVKDTKFKSGENAAIIETLTPAVQQEEKILTQTALKGTGMNELGKGIQFASTAGKVKVGAAFVAAGVAAYGIGNMMFPSHVRDVESRRAAHADMGRT